MPGSGFRDHPERINRKGRPKKGQCLTDILNWALDQKKTYTDKKTGEEKEVLLRQLLADKLLYKAINDGDVAAMKYIYDRIDGKPKESVEITRPGDIIPDDPLKSQAEIDQFKKELLIEFQGEQ